MSDLEDLSYVSSPHTPAGRVPTNQGYRFLVDTLVKVDPLDTYDLAGLNKSLDPDMTSQDLLESASDSCPNLPVWRAWLRYRKVSR